MKRGGLGGGDGGDGIAPAAATTGHKEQDAAATGYVCLTFYSGEKKSLYVVW